MGGAVRPLESQPQVGVTVAARLVAEARLESPAPPQDLEPEPRPVDVGGARGRVGGRVHAVKPMLDAAGGEDGLRTCAGVAAEDLVLRVEEPAHGGGGAQPLPLEILFAGELVTPYGAPVGGNAAVAGKDLGQRREDMRTALRVIPVLRVIGRGIQQPQQAHGAVAVEAGVAREHGAVVLIEDQVFARLRVRPFPYDAPAARLQPAPCSFEQRPVQQCHRDPPVRRPGNVARRPERMSIIVEDRREAGV